MKKIIFLATAISFLALQSCSDNSEKIPEHKVSIEAPFKTLKVNENTFTINPAEGKVLRLKDGSSLDIPANAFVDKYGNLVTSPVTITYKEFDDPAEIITSGIPMSCEDSAGKVRNFESGGMFELRGTAGGQEVSIAQGKNIGVNMASNIQGEYDFFFLEEAPGQEQATASLFPSANAQTPAANKQYYWKKINQKKDTAQSKREEKLLFSNDPKAPRFKLNFNIEKNPDLAALNTINWQYAGTTNKENPLAKENSTVLTDKWQDIDVSQPLYKITPSKTFVHGDNSGKASFWNFTALFNHENDRFAFEGVNNSIQVADWNGNILATLPNKQLTSHNFSLFQNFPRFFKSRYKNYFITTGYNEDYTTRDFTIYNFNGKEICSIKKASNLHILEKAQRIIYETTEDEVNYFLNICSIDGKLIKKIAITNLSKTQWVYYNIHHINIHPDQTHIATLSLKGIFIYDMNGQQLATHSVNDKMSSIHFPCTKDILIIEDDDKLLAWNWKTNQTKTQQIPNEVLRIYGQNYEMDVLHYNSFHKTKPLAIVQTEDDYFGKKSKSASAFLWNYETNTVQNIITEKAGTHIRADFSPEGNFIEVIVENRTLYCYSAQLKQLYTCKSTSRFFNLNSTNDSILLINGSDHMLALRSDGKILADFKKYDSLTTYALFTEDGNILSSATGGNVYLWNSSGKLLKKVLTPDNRNMRASVSIKGDNKFYTYHEEYYHIWDYDGNLLHTINNQEIPFAMSSNDGNRILSQKEYSTTDELNLCDLFKTKVEKGIWQLTLISGKKTFITFVRLTEEDYKKIKDFQVAKRKLVTEENVRAQEEEEVIRSFQVAKFGIYNWDKFYNDNDAQKIAVTLEFDTTNTAYSNYTIFHITGENLTTVIKHKEPTMKEFRFNAGDRNLLMVVLPGDRIGLLDEKSFKEATRNVKAGQAVTFKLKILDKAASTEELNKLLNKPPV